MTAPWRALAVAAALAPWAAPAQDAGPGDAPPGQDGGPAAEAPFPLRIRVGGSVSLCSTGTIICPAGAAFCDDPAVAVPEARADGLAFRGVGQGTTLCSAQAAQGAGMRRVYRVTVEAAPP